MVADVGQVLSRKEFKKMLMKLAGVSNRFRWSGFGTAIAMTEEVHSLEGNGIHSDIYKVLIHRAIEKGKVNTGRQIIEPVVNFATAVAGGQLESAGLGSVGSAASDLSGYDVDTSQLGIIYRDAVYRNEKKKDRWAAANQCALIVSRILVKVVQNQSKWSEPIVVYINNNAQNTATLDLWYNSLLEGESVSMVPHTYDILNKRLSPSAGGGVPTWAS